MDLQVLQGESAERGVGRYSEGLADAIIGTGQADVTAVLNTALPSRFEKAYDWAQKRLPKSAIRVFRGMDRTMGLIAGNEIRQQRAAGLYDAFVRRLGVDALHTPAPFDGMGDETVIGDRRLGVDNHTLRFSTLYDLIPFQEPELHLADARYKAWFDSRLAVLKTCDGLFAISDYTRKVAIDQAGIDPAKIVTIFADASPLFKPLDFTPDERRAVLHRFSITKPFIMHTGILEARKNVACLVSAFSKLPDEMRHRHQLVLIANATQAQKRDVLNYAAKCGLVPGDIVFPGYVVDEDLVKIYNLAQITIMPSFTEGFGLPLLEAMRCGTPVLGADTTSIPEVIGCDDYTFDPFSSDELALKIHSLLNDRGAWEAGRSHALRQQALFSWKRSAELAMDGFSELTNRHSARGDDFDVKYTFLGRKVQIDNDAIDIQASEQPNFDRSRLPLVVIEGNCLTNAQEKTLSEGPAIILHAHDVVRINTSPYLRYLTKGYGGLRDENLSIDVNSLRNIQGALFLGAFEPGYKLSSSTRQGLRSASSQITPILELLTQLPNHFPSEDATELAVLMGSNLLPHNRPPALLVDISELVHRDAKTGIQRVVRSILRHFLSMETIYRVEPVYREGDYYKYARAYTSRFLDLPNLENVDTYVTFYSGDIFLGLDLDATISEGAMQALLRERMRGVKLVWVIYDMLPVLRPEWFDVGLGDAVNNWVNRIEVCADQLVCISRAVADDVLSHLQCQKPDRIRDLTLSWWHLGADLGNIVPTRGISCSHQSLLDQISAEWPVFLTVGTIEPRKGIRRLLDGAEAFWKSGGNASFVLVGKQGWAVEPLIKYLSCHPEMGRRLFWFSEASDEVLESLYMRATAVILPSEGEGFGLPLVEATRHGKPVLARDLPVFREIGGKSPYYFNEKSGREFADSINTWLKMQKKYKKAAGSLKVKTWAESANDLYNAVVNHQEYKVWRRDV
ncbi:glycosyltransferase family 1 protein [Asticcacaulis sp. SL142]|uniref:glycosyltransferase family 4 protein n=1 Tax=Asticcacaulis sp. SL142 TaxID=2995155 RepID=UPI00226CC8C1|nr:glycosyltransferase family 1 protein [Asticcacaulis sp. SL142]WAC47063.1 glycosyltransferase family 1 protein [Asticcacaulis sp. SL142]